MRKIFIDDMKDLLNKYTSKMFMKIERCEKENKLLHKSDYPIIYMTGPPGIGKSDIVEEVALQNDATIIDIRLSQLNPEDLGGIPVPQKNQTIKWYVPNFLKMNPIKRHIIFFDEMDKADPAIQNAALQLIFDRKLGEYLIPPKVLIIAAGNRMEDNAFSMQMSTALMNRMLQFEIKLSSKAWIDWAEKKNIDNRVIDYIRFMQNKVLLKMPIDETQRAWPSPRSWVQTANMIKLLECTKAEEIHKIAESSIGKETAAGFAQYLKYYEGISPLSLLANNAEQAIEEFKDSDNTNYKYALVSCLSQYVNLQKVSVKLIAGYYTFLKKVGGEFGAVGVKILVRYTRSDYFGYEHYKKMRPTPELAEKLYNLMNTYTHILEKDQKVWESLKKSQEDLKKQSA